ncbi:uncharacterized protein N7484_005398 [Penicillium longicatenatum]|uniref:uncharacterized protein n=1 Tax=Penicillium longicatenatum TaxID=1561947 RepID=UPI0025494853|nr:uncharacterized protein N7484_005398 [Penicillium longicatenatum]KAJ5642891.1 hypothetical protein N7484_005398 [Penicillium longicatenatum]
MLQDHSKMSIALIVLYIPVILLSTGLACYRHKRPRMAWITLMFFSTIRIAAGIVVIISEQKPSVGVMIAATILLNAGVFPLIAATMGYIRIIQHISISIRLYISPYLWILKSNSVAVQQSMSPKIQQGLRLSRLLFLAGISLTIAGGALEGSDTTSDVPIGMKLVKAGYSIVVVFAAILLAIQAYFWTQYSLFSKTSRTILKAMAFGTPFIGVRITYLFLSVLHASDLRWNALLGPIAPFLVMGLLMEYFVVCIYLITGLLIPARAIPANKVIPLSEEETS